MKLSVFNTAGEDTGKKVDLKKDIFEVEPSDHAIYLDVKQYLANRRQGTAMTRERSDVSGSTRKIKRQKGTGTARAGSIKSPIFRGGGRVFGPRPKSYSFKLNKKVKELARLSALSYKAKEKGILVLEDFSMESPKTSEFSSISRKLNIDRMKSLLVLPEPNKNIYLSSRNLEKSKVITVSELNTYDIMNASVVVFLESSLNVLQTSAN
jgi:large subunit ribosomal protein L4